MQYLVQTFCIIEREAVTSTGDNLVATLRYVTIACQNSHMPGNSPQMFHFKGIANGIRTRKHYLIRSSLVDSSTTCCADIVIKPIKRYKKHTAGLNKMHALLAGQRFAL